MSHRRSGGVARPHVSTPPEDTQPEMRSGEFILEKDAIVEVVSQNLEKDVFFLVNLLLDNGTKVCLQLATLHGV